MKLESLELNKFKNDALKKGVMSKLNGGKAQAGTETRGGCRADAGDPRGHYTYGYDSDRGNGVITYHNRTYMAGPSCPLI